MPCAFARVSGVPTPSDPGSRELTDFIDLRDTLRHQRIGRGGLEVCEALTASLDRAIAGMVSPVPPGVSVVALGGYGRRELSPYSDVDLMLLHEIADPAAAAAALFRPLWDARLRVGHSVRNLKEASTAAKERFDTQTTLLTSRLITGEPGLFQAMMDEVTAVTRARPLRRHLVSEERQRRVDSPYLLMATNVKTGRGGLRTLHGFDWERRRETLIGRFSTDSRSEEEHARESLTQIRNAIHAVAGRGHEEFSPEIREPVARWLGVDTFSAAQSLVDALHTVDGLATQRWPEVAEPDRPKGRRVWARVAGRTNPPAKGKRPTLEEILWMLDAGEQGKLVFERLWEAGLLTEVLPEWEVVRSLPQLAPFHEHPVDAHLWRTVAEMKEMTSDGGPYQRVAERLAQPGLPLIAAFLHDIGKGHGGDHANVGADIAAAFSRRLDLTSEWAGLLEGAVRHHLLLAVTATRRDLDDPAVIDEIANTVGSVSLLRLIYLLTIADSRATGPTMWTRWKSTLVRTLFDRVVERLQTGPSELTSGTTREAVLSSVESRDGAALSDHLDGMPEDYLRSTSADDVRWHVDLILERDGLSALGVRDRSPIDTAVVVGHGGPDFRLRVAEAFAVNGVDVLEARMHTRSDGLVVDSFQVRDDRTGDAVRGERWERAGADIEAAIQGKLDTGSKVAERAAAYGTGGDVLAQPRVECVVDSASGDLVVIVKCSDRIGRLAEILACFMDCGLEVRLAKLDSRGSELIDTFHVRGGPEPRQPEDFRSLEILIAAGITT